MNKLDRTEEGEYEFANHLTFNERQTFADRLLNLRGMLLGITPEQYAHESMISQYRPELSCGTSACAFGWAALNVSRFPGLNIRLQQTPGLCLPEVNVVDDSGTETGGDSSDEANRYFGEGAWEELFDNGTYRFDDNGDLIDGGKSDRYVKPADVIARIEELVTQRYGIEVQA